MAGEWHNMTWGDLATLEYGKALRGYENANGPYPVYGTNGPIGCHAEPLYQSPSVIIGRKGAYRGIHYSRKPFWAIDTAFYLKPKVEIDIRWAYYQLLTHDINSMDSGSAIPSTSRESFYLLPVRLPPLGEQRAIAHILGTLDDKIECLRRMNETLEAMARALFKSWFIDFEPVRAKAEGRDPGLPKSIADLFPAKFQDSELGRIPKGWRVETLGDVMELAYGKALKEEDRRPGTIPVFGSNGQVGWHDDRLVEGPGIVVGRKGNSGTVTWAPTDFFPIDTTFYVVPKTKDLSLHFLFYALLRHDLPSLGADSAVPGLNRNMAYMSQQVLPPPSIIQQFEKHAEPLYSRMHENDVETRTLCTIRDALLPKLLSGELRVKDAERFLKERRL